MINWGNHTVINDDCSTSEIYGQLWPRGGDKRPGSSNDVSYTPASPSDWSGTPPTTIAEAIDRLASSGAPIP